MKERIAKILGYMTAQQAHGFTNHGAMYGVLCWIADPDGSAPMVATKWAPMEWFVSLGHWVTGLQMDLLGVTPHFRVAVGREIAAPGVKP